MDPNKTTTDNPNNLPVELSSELSETPQGGTDNLPESPSQKPKSNRVFRLVILIFMLLFIGSGVYLFFKLYSQKTNLQVGNNPSETPTSTEAQNITEVPSAPATLETMLSDLVTSEELELNDANSMTIGKCKGTGLYKGIIQNGNAYSLGESNLTADVIQYCPDNLTATFNETYWIGDKIYYKQYRNKPFAEKNPNQPIAIGENPKHYLKRILPDPATIQNLKEVNGATREISFSGTTEDKIKITYTASVSDNKITKLTYRTYAISDPDFGSYRMEGSIRFTTPDVKITAPKI